MQRIWKNAALLIGCRFLIQFCNRQLVKHICWGKGVPKNSVLQRDRFPQPNVRILWSKLQLVAWRNGYETAVYFYAFPYDFCYKLGLKQLNDPNFLCQKRPKGTNALVTFACCRNILIREGSERTKSFFLNNPLVVEHPNIEILMGKILGTFQSMSLIKILVVFINFGAHSCPLIPIT